MTTRTRTCKWKRISTGAGTLADEFVYASECGGTMFWFVWRCPKCGGAVVEEKEGDDER